MPLKSRLLIRIALTAFSGGLYAAFPDKPITIVIPFAAGGPTDALARALSISLAATLKQPVTIESVPGGGGTLGTSRVVKAKPDGHTLLFHNIGLSATPALHRSLPFNVTADVEPIALVADVPLALIARTNFPGNDFREFVAYARANKGKVTMGNAGPGSATHLCGMMIMSAIETDLTTVPFKGTGPAIKELHSGQLDVMCDQTITSAPQIKAGKVKALGITSRTRAAALKDLPTLDEQGAKGFEVVAWTALFTSKDTPKDVIDTLARAVQTAIQDPQVRARLQDAGAEPVAVKRATPEALRAHLKAEIDRWTPLIKKAGVYAD